MCIPVLFICGTTESVKPAGEARFCSNCGTKDGAQLFTAKRRGAAPRPPAFATGCWSAAAARSQPAQESARPCPLLSTPVRLCRKFHLCFIPLCQTGDERRFYRCHNCGAMYPA